MKEKIAALFMFWIFLTSCATPNTAAPPTVLLPTTTVELRTSPSVVFTPIPTLTAVPTSTLMPTFTPSPASTAPPPPLLTATITVVSSPNFVAPLPGDLILRLTNEEFRLWREGSEIRLARLEDFNRHFRDPVLVRARWGDQLVSFPLVLLPERRAVRLVRPEGDGPSKEVMYSDDRYKNFLAGTVAGSDWGYATVIQSNGREMELFFGEPLGDHHQGAARQKLPSWIQKVHRIFWEGENLLMIVRTSKDKFGVVRVNPGARQSLPEELARDAWNARHQLSEFLMRYNKSLQRSFRPLWLGDEELVDLAIVR